MPIFKERAIIRNSLCRYRSDVGGLSPYSDRKDSLELEGVLGKRARTGTPPLSERVMLYVRQDTDDVYTPLHVAPPTTQGLLHAVSPNASPTLPHTLDTSH